MSQLILIVDDNENNRKLARDVLQFAGFDTIEATGGVEGVALAQEHAPALVLMEESLSVSLTVTVKPCWRR